MRLFSRIVLDPSQLLTNSLQVHHVYGRMRRYLIEAKIDAGGDDNLVIYFIWPKATIINRVEF